MMFQRWNRTPNPTGSIVGLYHGSVKLCHVLQCYRQLERGTFKPWVVGWCCAVVVGSCWGRYLGIGYHPGPHPGYEHIARIAASSPDFRSFLRMNSLYCLWHNSRHSERDFSHKVPGHIWCIIQEQLTLPETNIAPENRASQRETSIPTINFQVRAVSFSEGIACLDEGDLLPLYFMQTYAWETHRQKDFTGLDVTEMHTYQGFSASVSEKLSGGF